MNEKRLQNGWRLALGWQGCSLEELWLLSCHGRGEMKRGEHGSADCGLVRDSRNGETASEWETRRKHMSLKTRKIELGGCVGRSARIKQRKNV